MGPGLARDWHGIPARAFPEFEQIRHVVSRRDAQLLLGILCSILLSYADIHPLYLAEGPGWGKYQYGHAHRYNMQRHARPHAATWRRLVKIFEIL
ncbi:hypothetical protein GHA01_09700 [Novacetimonas hansenii]|uniref:Uncharacterized protein n=1 Tax=Novacetimonas hansenii TaxID=436 RepID=A0ABQ0SCZ9_NOVHA|nr:hypothetical protein CFR74_09200 [Novacetimonas hansenii]GAN84720.1 hypothetical protein Gaha_0202_010 [Novacetimonas hansenii JCM 7643]GBQ52391.1 hypothetical protein AA0243_0012 [Novacetimonas hansenii NRIC 0243]GEC63121.1 hypothetical protein GHA01_09700 [Novacetimonas hansenii]